MSQPRLYANRTGPSGGFSTLELLLVMVVSLVVAALAIPGFNQVRRTLRISGDARDLNGAINQAKLQAAADFTDTRVYIDLNVGSPLPGGGASNDNTFHVDVWNKNLNCWQTAGDLDNFGQPRCMIPGTSPVQTLSQGVTFGFAGVGAPPPNTQANGISQGPPCAPVNGRRVGQMASTACVRFNSRGIPTLPNGTPTGNEAVYITDGVQVYAVTLGATGMSQVWASNIQGNANWYHK